MDLELRGKSALITGASKGIGLACALGSENVDYGVRVVGVNPGRVETERQQKHMMEDAEKKFGDPARWKEIQAEVFKALPFKRSAYPAEVADLVTFLASARAAYISATVVTIDAGQSLRQRTY